MTTPLPAVWSTDVYSWSDLADALARPVDIRPPAILHLARHGQTETNASGLMSGAADVELTDLGWQQAQDLGAELGPRYDLAFHSGLSRSKATLYRALDTRGAQVGRVLRDERLNERSLGAWERRPFQHVEEFANGDLQFAPPDGQSYSEVARRVLSFLFDLSQVVGGAADAPASVLVCGHAGPMRIMLGILEDATDPAAVLGLSFHNARLIRRSWSSLTLPKFLAQADDALYTRPHPALSPAHS